MDETLASAQPITSRLLAEGAGWRAEEVICRCGPDDPGFEEAHDWTAVAAVMSGVFTYRTWQGRAVLARGALMLGEAGKCFECGHEHGMGDRCVSFHFSPAFAEDVAGGLAGVRRAGFARPSLAPVDSLAPLMVEARALAAAPDPLRAEQAAIAMASAALAGDQDGRLQRPSAREEAQAVQAARIIQQRFAEPLTIAGLAAEVGLSRRRFATAFRATLGATPYHYILGRRLEAAAERLAAGEDGVLQVALDCGFGDLSEFTRRFSARFGRPPARWRRARA
ncbi:AraC family transcriptional regulator [Phenylobacterium montanum]|uniref:Helix-turn-helix transcriptional regulator n=1 Tax=Phenylobacterium montanum TaxID=2823693 RepID=A0A975IVG0_9CAUL|nr:AraC family transcriptional regulator [Caulobacter sp. S6]QUD87286.1 helix-turn-helix transcriptional regulator [Caulobacter sp. S6]